MSDTRRLAQELYEIRSLALSHATSPQVGSSSVDGDGLVFRDGDGNDLGRIGGDGNGFEVEYLYGPKPDQPSAPIVSSDTNLISVRWDGLWADGSATTDPDIVEPGSLDRVEVHVSSDENFVPDPINSFAGTIPVAPEGGTALVGPLAEAGDWYVVLLARGKDGQYGVPSDRVHVVTSVGLVENELFDLALRAGEAMESADGKNSVYYGDEEPEPQPRLDENDDPVLDDDGNPLFNEFSEGDIWFGPGNMPHVWSEADGWVSAADERVDAVQSAVDSLEEDIRNIVVDASGTTTYWLPDEPVDPPPKDGDVWFRTSGGNITGHFERAGGVWVEHLLSHETIASIDAGRITVGELDGARIKAGTVQADLALIESSIGSTLIADGAVTTDKILAGAVTTEKITAGGIDAGVITTGELRGELIRAQSIAASALAADAIDGKTITGATVRTSAAGARVEMNSTGLYVKNQFGANTVSMQNGAISVEGGTITGGTVRTSASGARVQLDVTGLKAFNPDGDETFVVSANTGAVDMLGNLRQVNGWGRLRVGPDVFAAGEAGLGAPAIGIERLSPPSGMNRAGVLLNEPPDGDGSVLFVQGEWSDAGTSIIQLPSPDSSAGTGLWRSRGPNRYDSFTSSGVGATVNSRQPAGEGGVWLRTYSGTRDHPQAYMSVTNDGGAYIATRVGSNEDAVTGLLSMTTDGVWLRAGSGNSATAARNLWLNAYGNAYMQAYGTGNSPSREAWVYAERGGMVGLRGGTSGSDRGSWIGITESGTTQMRSRSGEVWLSRQNASGSSTWSSISLTSDGIRLGLANNTSYGVYMNTLPANTGAVPIGRITGQLYSISSSRKYKLMEEPIDARVEGFEDKLLSIEAKTWVDRGAAERLADYYTAVEAGEEPERGLDDIAHLNRIPGVVAEDLEDAGLSMFVHYEDGEPEAVLYDRIGPALIPIVRGLRDRINELEERMGMMADG